jgi:hypothetical protein
MRRLPRLPIILVLAWIVWAVPASACNVPVFRYALERWRAQGDDERYKVTIFHDRPFTPQERTTVDALRALSEGVRAQGNLRVEVADVASPLAEPLRKLWKGQGNVRLPWMVVRYPESAAEGGVAWTGPFNDWTARRLMDSPARRELAKRLLKGEAAVWVLLESSDKERNDAAVALVEAELAKLSRTLKLPEGIGDDSVKLLSNLPLAISFSLVRIKHNDPAEEITAALLRNWDTDIARSSEPVVFPVFGRGRVLDGMLGKGINPENVGDSAAFVCGACSCQVKALNPGVDLLITADWDSVLTERDAEPEPLAGGDLRVPIPRGVHGTTAVPPLSSVEETGKWPLLQYAALAVFAILGVICVAMMLRKWRRNHLRRFEVERPVK